MSGAPQEHCRKLSDAAKQRCEKVASMYLQGVRIGDIAEQLNVHRKTIHSDLDRARKLWRENASDTYDSHVEQQLAKLDEIESAAWVGWHRSLRDALDTGTEDGTVGEATISKTRINRKTQTGNASFLKIVNDSVRQRSELLGLMDSSIREANNEGEEAEVVSIVIESREEAGEFRSLSLSEFRAKVASAG